MTMRLEKARTLPLLKAQLPVGRHDVQPKTVSTQTYEHLNDNHAGHKGESSGETLREMSEWAINLVRVPSRRATRSAGLFLNEATNDDNATREGGSTDETLYDNKGWGPNGGTPSPQYD